jgi:hypothetical protein
MNENTKPALASLLEDWNVLALAHGRERVQVITVEHSLAPF